MRVAIIGSHGVGKTELAHAVGKATGFPTRGSVARDVIQGNGFKDADSLMAAPWHQRLFVQSAIFDEMLERDRILPKGIFDTCPLDILAYSHLYETSSAWLVRQVIRHVAENYDLLVYVPIGQERKHDGFRLTGHQREIAEIMRSHLDGFQGRNIAIMATTKASLQGRVNEIMEVMRYIRG